MSSLRQIPNFGNYPGDYRNQSGERELHFKIWRLQTSIWRPRDAVQNLESPGLSGRADSPALYTQDIHRAFGNSCNTLPMRQDQGYALFYTQKKCLKYASFLGVPLSK